MALKYRADFKRSKTFILQNRNQKTIKRPQRNIEEPRSNDEYGPRGPWRARTSRTASVAPISPGMEEGTMSVID